METIAQPNGKNGLHEGSNNESNPGNFPLDALSPVMRNIADSVADTFQVPVAMPAMAALAIHAGAMGKTYWVVDAVNGQRSYGNLYVIAAAARGGGKSTVAGALAKPLMDANDALTQRFLSKKHELEAKAAVLQRQIDGLLRKATNLSEDPTALTQNVERKTRELAAIAPDGVPIRSPSMIEGNVTSEALAVALRAGDQALIIYSPEAGDLVRVALGKYNKGERGDFDLLLSGWSSEASNRNRVSSGRNNLCPTLSALLFIQPYILAELLTNEEAFERGLTARPLIFDSQIELQDDDGKVRFVPEDVALAWREHIRWCAKDRPSKAPSFDVRCSPEAREVFRHFHNESNALRRGRCADVEGELCRWRENAIRVALNLWLADGAGGWITAEQAERAVRIVRWCGRAYLVILNQGRGARKYSRAQGLRAILIEMPERTITLRDLANRHNYDQGEVRSLAAEFPDLLKIEPRLPGSQGGRPSEVLTLASAAARY